MKTAVEQALESLQQKRKHFIGNHRDSSSIAETKGFLQGLDWAIDTIQTAIENENFKSEDWEFEASSGYYGYRNKITDEWLYECNYNILKNKKEKMKTAVEFYNSKVIELMKQREEGTIDVLSFRNELDEIFEKSKAMEKEQNIEFVRLNLNKAIKSFRPKLLLIAIMLIMFGVLLSINL